MTYQIILAAVLLSVLAFVVYRLKIQDRRRWVSHSDTWDFEGLDSGMPDHPDFPSGVGCAFQFPQMPDHVNMLTRPFDRLSGRLRVEYEIVGNAEFVARQTGKPGQVSLYFQRKGDDWDSGPETQWYRWYSRSFFDIAPGRNLIEIPFEQSYWKPVNTGENEAMFVAALNNVRRAGIVFGGPGGRGHGAYATAPCGFILHSFEVV